MLKKILEKINIVNIAFDNRLKMYKNHKVMWNNKVSHNLYDRFVNRIKPTGITLQEFIKKIQKGLQKILDYGETERNYFLQFKKSKFNLVVTFNKDKSFYIRTFLDEKKKSLSRDDIKLDLQENNLIFLEIEE